MVILEQSNMSSQQVESLCSGRRDTCCGLTKYAILCEHCCYEY